MHQLHTITESLAHDLRSPLTAIRGKLEIVRSGDLRIEQSEPIVSAIDEVDRLTEFLNSSLDVAEAKADALMTFTHGSRSGQIDSKNDHLYEPSTSEKGLRVHLRSDGSVTVSQTQAFFIG